MRAIMSETHPLGPRAVHVRTCDRVRPVGALHARNGAWARFVNGFMTRHNVCLWHLAGIDAGAEHVRLAGAPIFLTGVTFDVST
jgi:hypothetical protein